MRVGWIVNDPSAAIASTRYRCYYPAAALSDQGVQNRVFSRSEDVLAFLSQLDAIVFVKYLDNGSLNLAVRAYLSNVRIYIDLCDNIILSTYGGDRSAAPTQIERRRTCSK